jgi:hypothetical protein
VYEFVPRIAQLVSAAAQILYFRHKRRMLGIGDLRWARFSR